MKELISNEYKEEDKAILVGVNLNDAEYFEESMKELKSLAEACNIKTSGIITQNLKAENRVHYIGTGKIQEVVEMLEETEAEIVIFNNELTPSQLKNLSKEIQCNIMDRTSLILEIFASRAKTKEAKLQVEIANLQYLLPRLAGSYKALGRQAGGSGTSGTHNKGSGEKKIELDRRKIEDKITVLSKDLENLVSERKVQRKQRNKNNIPTVALVGYTNAGKSSIMNAVVEIYRKDEEKKVFEKDMLFATLETSVRKISLPNHKTFILADTVGFVSDLPHNLVKAFRSTLEEVSQADLLCHVVDFSNENFMQQIEVTNDTLRQIGAKDIPMIYVYNKSDLTEIKFPQIKNDKVYISAKQRIGIEEFVKAIEEQVLFDYVNCRMLIPYEQGHIVSYFNDNANIARVSYETNGTLMDMEIRGSDYDKYSYLSI